MKLELSGKYLNDLSKLTKNDPALGPDISLAIKRFRNNPKDTRLYVHALKRKLKGKHSFSVNEDVRIVFECLGKKTVRFLAIGRHKDVYKK